MRVKFVNKLTKTVMFVDEKRVPEYLAAGHTPAAKPAKTSTSTKKPQKKKAVK